MAVFDEITRGWVQVCKVSADHVLSHVILAGTNILGGATDAVDGDEIAWPKVTADAVFLENSSNRQSKEGRDGAKRGCQQDALESY